VTRPPTCRVCGATRSERLFRARDHHYGNAGEWWIRRCEPCESWFLEDDLDAADLARLYPDDEYYAYSLTAPSTWRRIVRAVLGYSRPPREPRFAQPGRMLDFGCGAGEHLLTLRERGWACAGVEMNGRARDIAKSAGLDVREEIVGPRGFTGDAFDYVRANHSLEHVTDPRQTLAELCGLLKPGGLLFLGLPVASSQNARVFGRHWWHLCAPLHQFVPSERAVLSLVEGAGLSVRQVAFNSDFGGTAGSVQISLNQNTGRRASEGLIFRIKPLLLLGDIAARIQDAFRAGDRIEVTAVKPQ
jgi:SAM-dependent methyltransferase